MSAEMIATELAPPQINALYRLPDDFWPRLRSAPYKHDLFQLLRRIDARGGQPYLLGRAPLPRHEMLRPGGSRRCHSRPPRWRRWRRAPTARCTTSRSSASACSAPTDRCRCT